MSKEPKPANNQEEAYKIVIQDIEIREKAAFDDYMEARKTSGLLEEYDAVAHMRKEYYSDLSRVKLMLNIILELEIKGKKPQDSEAKLRQACL